MKSLAVAMALCTLISSASAADQTCKAKAIKQKLAGEALLNFVKQCETDAMVACANKTAGKPDSDTLMDACVANALGVGPRWCEPHYCSTKLIALAVLDVRFAGPDFADGNSQWLRLPFETAPPETRMDRLAEGTMRHDRCNTPRLPNR
jgi:hypothetical protein